ncbi:outer membrane beta-barrel protein [Subsaximicrobium wynnwilliamsii]|uniref:Outer membrane beta-barrel protein n=1 Tax=Subsaximicrobium wynnwilliamsii TaxID=291179 RepID=A0A5C6ZAN7_9FLAO|nr:TonB-dependent receptor [Subsaximicrobium wynnwilliamsii]TXD81906.1 outer membrane beta-barrel protein [Subsaximicrobium wynnwilliamsii]TXD87025.1 outer membrane beta-barrel protein [Subsaximicrobium wynnwilliamsii]TXE01357.1 outer membrane beta-barrel protein [Subsaximicrobium wynnwilliamsii]
MKKLIILFTLFTTSFIMAQNTGSIVGMLTDKEYNNEPLAFANVLIKGTTTGTTSDFDGIYSLENLDPGPYTLVFSFVGYETQELVVEVVAGKVTTINVPMGANPGALDEIVITTTARKDSEVALLLDQKKAVEIKESIGAEQLTQLGVSDASGATAKISGVSKSEGTGQVYVRGLGDRYLTTTLNGLPVPSDNIDKKNIDLGLFPARFIQNVAVSKTFSPKNSSDQASGNIDIVSKEVTKRRTFGLSANGGVNSNIANVFDNFKVTANNSDVNFGLYSRAYEFDELSNAITGQSWTPQQISAPVNYSYGFNAGGIIGEARKLRLFISAGQSIENEYREGIFREYDQGNLRDSVPDGDNIRWRREVNTTGMFHGQFKFNDNNKVSLNSFIINKVFEETYEAGRSGGAVIFEELDGPQEGFQFVRDQNLKNTIISITQLIGEHNFSDDNKLEWAAGYNYVIANEPNRIRNEVNILNEDDRIQLGFTGGFQQRKSAQDITDKEYNARLQDEIILKKNENDDAIYKVSFGGNYRNKKRDFQSQFIGAEEAFTDAANPSSIDAISEIFTQSNFDNGILQLNTLQPDTYEGELVSYAGYADFIGVFNKFTAEVGLRYQSDAIDVGFDVGNYVDPATGISRIGTSNQSYERFYPAVNLKYNFTDKFAVRLAGSLSQTLPEFKEIAPFQYVSPENQVTQGNPDVEASRDLNVDLKFELFPTNEELLSLTAFYKQIKDPINRTLQRGGENIFSYFNSGNKATVIGVELEGRIYVVKKQDSLPNLKLSGNISYIDHKQDLKEIRDGDGNLLRTFKYGGKDEIGLEGASDWITNLALTLNTGSKYPYEFTLAGNYASDRIFSLGAPRNQNQPEVFYNGEITEQGVVVLDFIFSKDIDERWTIGATAKNLLNPTIKRVQLIESAVDGIRSEETVLSYSTGVNAAVSISYKF